MKPIQSRHSKHQSKLSIRDGATIGLQTERNVQFWFSSKDIRMFQSIKKNDLNFVSAADAIVDILHRIDPGADIKKKLDGSIFR